MILIPIYWEYIINNICYCYTYITYINCRNDAKKTLKAMMSHPNFDSLFYQDVDSKIISNVEKQLVSLK